MNKNIMKFTLLLLFVFYSLIAFSQEIELSGVYFTNDKALGTEISYYQNTKSKYKIGVGVDYYTRQYNEATYLKYEDKATSNEIQIQHIGLNFSFLYCLINNEKSALAIGSVISGSIYSGKNSGKAFELIHWADDTQYDDYAQYDYYSDINEKKNWIRCVVEI